MSDLLETRAEIAKLARVLGTDVSELAYLEQIDGQAIAAFRQQLLDIFYGSEGGGLEKFAKVGNLLPSSIIASLTKEAVGPVLASRIAGFIDAKQAAQVVGKLPTPFVADIAVEIDPRRIEPVISRLPDKTVDALAIELVNREEYVVMGQFVAFVNDSTLNHIFTNASDEALLQIGFVTEDKSRLSDALATVSDERVISVIKTALAKHHWPEAIDLLCHLSDEQYLRLINITAELDAKSLDQMIDNTNDPVLWQVLIPALAQMDDPTAPVAALLRGNANAIKGFGSTIVEDQAWDEVRELLDKLDERTRLDLRKRLASNKLADAFEPVADVLVA